jgi:redox-sensitive bicupin YhaK (pirin superfamily)
MFDRVVSTPPPQPGFIGEGHLAVEVVSPADLARTDPFVALMDDRLDIALRRQIGGPHPHAGFETVTFVLEGTADDRDEGRLETGDVLWMTAGRGIIHNEHVEVEGHTRILQLWVRLSKADRAAEPRFELIRGAQVPVRREPGVVAKLYSGTTGDLTSPTKNHVPVTLVDVKLEPASSFEQQLPATWNGFIYVLEGSLVGAKQGQVAWIGSERPVRLTARDEGARFVLYAGQRQNEPIVQRGPFVADDEQMLLGMFRDYRAGLFTRMSVLSGGHHVRRDAVAAPQ